MEEFINKIRPELLLLAIALYFIGVILKKIPKLKDNFIPLILGVLGVVGGIVYIGIVEGWTYSSFITGTVQGVLCAGASTYVNQVIKQLLKLNNVEDAVADKVADTITDKIAK